MGLLDDLFPKPKNIASDILRRDVRPGGVGERSPVSSHHGDAVLQGSSHAEDVFLDTQPTLAQESLGRSSRDRTVHVDNFPATTKVSKVTVIETTTPLAANGVFTGPWHDSQVDGAVYVTASSFSNVAAANNGLLLQESDDQNNATFTRTFAQTAGAINAGVLNRVGGYLKARYWRAVYTNGVGVQASFELTVCAVNMALFPNVSGTPDTGISVSLSVSTPNIAQADNDTAVTFIPNSAGAVNPMPQALMQYGGLFSGTPDAVRQGWSKARTPTVFRQVSTAGTGSTAIWTPGAGNKFRLLGFRVQVTARAAATVAADLVIKLLDVALDLGLASIVSIPAAGLTAGDDYDSGWIPLGSFGILSAVAGNALNLNLSFALTAGLVNVNVCGTEE